LSILNLNCHPRIKIVILGSKLSGMKKVGIRLN
jgi:hypothetical protein